VICQLKHFIDLIMNIFMI